MLLLHSKLAELYSYHDFWGGLLICYNFFLKCQFLHNLHPCQLQRRRLAGRVGRTFETARCCSVRRRSLWGCPSRCGRRTWEGTAVRPPLRPSGTFTSKAVVGSVGWPRSGRALVPRWSSPHRKGQCLSTPRRRLLRAVLRSASVSGCRGREPARMLIQLSFATGAVSTGFIAGAGGGVAQTIVMGPCTFLVTAVVRLLSNKVVGQTAGCFICSLGARRSCMHGSPTGG